MPELWFEVYCGVCGKGVCFDTVVDGQTLTVTCKKCLEMKKKVDKMAKKKDKKKKGCK